MSPDISTISDKVEDEQHRMTMALQRFVIAQRETIQGVGRFFLLQTPLERNDMMQSRSGCGPAEILKDYHQTHRGETHHDFHR